MKAFLLRLNAAKILSAAFIMAIPVLITSCVSTVEMNAARKKNLPARLNRERSIRIYPDLFKKIIHVKNKGDAEVDFYVFDEEYTMIYHKKMRGNEHILIENLSAGSYIYEVFTEDIRTEYGKLTVR